MKTNFLSINVLPTRAEIFLLTVIIIIFSAMQLSAQNSDYVLPLKTGDKVLEENIQNPGQVAGIFAAQLFDNKCYVLLQFYELPDTETHKAVKTAGIDLTEYVSGTTYRAIIHGAVSISTLENLGIRAVEKLAGVEKIEPLLLENELPEHIEVVDGKLDIQVNIHDSTPMENVTEALKGFEIEYLEEEQGNDKYLQMRIAKGDLVSIATMPYVNYIYPVAAEPTLLGGGRGTSIRSEYLNNVYGLYGEGVVTAVLEGGGIDNIDLSNATNISSYTSCADHVSLVSGMLGAEGILYPSFQGVASKATIFTGASDLTDTDLLGTPTSQGLIQQGLVVATSSLGLGGVTGNYDSRSRRADRQHLEHPQLIQLAAAGNSGLNSDYANMQGARQSAKNAISVGNINKENEISPKSSKGPTTDGRLKPEIVAIGTLAYTTGCNDEIATAYTGTSFSSPQAAGGLALLYEYYREQFSNANPDNALMKAVACNTADDLGNPGPDYTYGFGKMNLRKAVEALENNWYASDNFVAGATTAQTVDINVPAGVHQLKVMLYWADQPASSTTDQSVSKLVNNLDVSLNTPTGNHLPLVLDPFTPGADAANGVDNLNNIEQVVVTASPLQSIVSGTYTINVNPTDVPFDQPYYLTWEFVEPEITITSPYPGEVIANGASSNYYIEWDYDGDNDVNNTFTITINDNNGNQLFEETGIPGDVRIYKWFKCEALDINTSDLKVVVTRTGTVNYSAENTFSVYNAVTNNTVRANYMCGDQVCLSWNIKCGTTEGTAPAFFTVYRYDETIHDMVAIHTTTDYSATLNFDTNNSEEWYAVSTSYYAPDGTVVETERTSAKRFIPGNTPCDGTEDCSTTAGCANQAGTACDDGDDCTTGDVYDASCNCVGTFEDTDSDGVCDANDICPDGDDNIDTDGNGIPDACEDDCPVDLIVVDADVSGDYEASNTITTDESTGAMVLVDNGEQLTLNAGYYVKLTPGFSAKAGSIMRAYIQGCTLNGQKTEQATLASVKHYPNPFSDKVTLEFQLDYNADAAIIISDVNGRKVTQLQVDDLTRGTQTHSISTQNWMSGIYFYQVQIKEQDTGILKRANGTLVKM